MSSSNAQRILELERELRELKENMNIKNGQKIDKSKTNSSNTVVQPGQLQKKQSIEGENTVSNGAKEGEDYYIDKHGRRWHFHSRTIMENNATAHPFRDICVKLGLYGSYGHHTNTIYFYCKLNNLPKYTRQKGFTHCPFKGVFLYSTGCFYTMDEHNHPLGLLRPIPNEGEDYLDQNQRKWTFYARLDKNNMATLPKMANQLCLNIRQRGKNATRYGCKMTSTSGRGGRRNYYKLPNACQFCALFLRKNNCLYISGEHNHDLVEAAYRMVPNEGDDYLSRRGQKWYFMRRIDGIYDAEAIWKIKQEFWVYKNKTTDSISDYFICKSICMRSKKYQPGPSICQFRALVLKANNCLYVRNEHNHPIGQQAMEAAQPIEQIAAVEQQEGGGADLEILVDELKAGNKFLKKEGEDQTGNWPILTIEEDEEEEQHLPHPQYRRGRANLLPVKKEEPREADEQISVTAGDAIENQPPLNARPATPPKRQKMLLRERKRRMNYAAT